MFEPNNAVGMHISVSVIYLTQYISLHMPLIVAAPIPTEIGLMTSLKALNLGECFKTMQSGSA